MMRSVKNTALLGLLMSVVLVALAACASSEEVAPTAPSPGELPSAAPSLGELPSAAPSLGEPPSAAPSLGEPPPVEGDASPAGGETAPWAGSGFSFGEAAVWPDYIPEDIPPLEGEIATLMEVPNSHVRLLYHNLPERQIKDYLAQLEEQGFQLQGIVYEDPANPDRAQEKLEEGDFDAVDITKGAYHMRLEYGADSASYDIYTQGFAIEGPAVEGPSWPEELAGLLPPPERCKLVTVSPISDGGYSITCSRQDENVDADYIQLLQFQNLVEQERIEDQDGKLISLRLGDGQVTVLFSPAFEIYLTFTVLLDQTAASAGPSADWPAELEGRVPAPERCDLSSVLPARPGTYSIWCEPQDPAVIDDYLALLQETGFTEDDRFEDYQGALLSVSLIQDDLSVELRLAFSPTLVINIGPAGQ